MTRSYTVSTSDQMGERSGVSPAMDYKRAANYAAKVVRESPERRVEVWCNGIELVSYAPFPGGLPPRIQTEDPENLGDAYPEMRYILVAIRKAVFKTGRETARG